MTHIHHTINAVNAILDPASLETLIIEWEAPGPLQFTDALDANRDLETHPLCQCCGSQDFDVYPGFDYEPEFCCTNCAAIATGHTENRLLLALDDEVNSVEPY